jgi:hypothetical protein
MPKGKQRTVPAWIAPSARGAAEHEPVFSVAAWWPAPLELEEATAAIAARVMRVLGNYGGSLSHGGISVIDNVRVFVVTWAFGQEVSEARGAARALSQMHGVKHVVVIRQPGDTVIWTKRTK